MGKETRGTFIDYQIGGGEILVLLDQRMLINYWISVMIYNSYRISDA